MKQVTMIGTGRMAFKLRLGWALVGHAIVLEVAYLKQA